MAKILLIDGESIKPLDKVKFTEEGKLQDYLEKYPSLIPLSEIVEEASDLLCIGREVIAGPGAIDLLFIDKDGLLTVVETKLAKNPEARRTVIGQIIEYASYISQWTADDVYRIAGEYGKSNLDEVMGNMGEEFRSNIERNLRNGKMRLIIAVDELIEPLRATVTFLNSHSDFDVLLLQVSSFEESESRKVLIPLLFGYAQKEPGTRPPRRKINEEIFLDRCREGGHERAIELYFKVKALKESRRNNGDFINWGVSGYSYRIPWKGYPLGTVIFVAYPNSIEIWLSGIIEGCGKTGQEFKENLRNIGEFRGKVDAMKTPWASTDTMTQEDINALISAVEELGEALDTEARIESSEQ